MTRTQRGASVRGCLGAGVLRCSGAALIILAAVVVSAQDATDARVMAAVRVALAPALPFPDTDQTGASPADGKVEPLWMVRPPEPGDLTIEVLANPLNELNQQRAARAMAQIQDNIESAQRRAAAQYDRAIAEAKRTGTSQEVDGVTLSDEGIAGAKIDADSHVVIDVAFNQPSYTFTVSSSVPPSPQQSVPGAVVIAMPANTYRDQQMKADRYAEAETLVFMGRLEAPEVQRRDEHSYAVTAGVTPSPDAPLATLVIHFRGNEGLIADLLRRSDWNRLLELLK
jgi:hypothetical protein